MHFATPPAVFGTENYMETTQRLPKEGSHQADQWASVLRSSGGGDKWGWRVARYGHDR
jgi:hypothetical protein